MSTEAIQILAHRGWWEKPEERNTLAALNRAFAAGLGIETDLRDYAGEIVISHDPPLQRRLTFRDALDAYARAGKPGWLALNVKADGLQNFVKPLLEEFNIERYFMFDMSVPDALQWIKAGVRTFSRQSEQEHVPALYDQIAGVWLDAFASDWYGPEVIRDHLACGKEVAVVSPELHGREHRHVWEMLKGLEVHQGNNIMLCTDLPADAMRYFHE